MGTRSYTSTYTHYTRVLTVVLGPPMSTVLWFSWDRNVKRFSGTACGLPVKLQVVGRPRGMVVWGIQVLEEYGTQHAR